MSDVHTGAPGDFITIVKDKPIACEASYDSICIQMFPDRAQAYLMAFFEQPSGPVTIPQRSEPKLIGGRLTFEDLVIHTQNHSLYYTLTALLYTTPYLLDPMYKVRLLEVPPPKTRKKHTR